MKKFAILIALLAAGCIDPAHAHPKPGTTYQTQCTLSCETPLQPVFKLEYAYKFNGSTSRCFKQYFLQNPLQGAAQVTIAAWVRPVAPTASGSIFSVFKTGGAAEPHHVTQFDFSDPTAYRWVNNTGAGSHITSDTSAVNTGTWQFLVWRINTDTNSGDVWVGDYGDPSLTGVTASTAGTWSPLDTGAIMHEVSIGGLAAFGLYADIEVAQVGAWTSLLDPESLWDAGAPADWSTLSPGFHYEPDADDDGSALDSRGTAGTPWNLACVDVVKVAGPSA